MKLLTGSQLGQALCDGLGIASDNVTRIHVNCEAGRAAEVLVQYVVKDSVAGEFSNALKRYILIEAQNGS